MANTNIVVNTQASTIVASIGICLGSDGNLYCSWPLTDPQVAYSMLNGSRNDLQAKLLGNLVVDSDSTPSGIDVVGY